MKTTKLVIGIFSMVFFFFIVLQSCATGVANAFSGNSDDLSGIAGIFLALFMLVAGIIGVATRKENKGGYFAAAFYMLAAIIGFSSLGTFADLVIWSSLSLIFAIIFIIPVFLKKKSILVSPEAPLTDKASQGTFSVAQKLTDLKKLLDDGIINEEEFAKQKAKVLDSE